MTHLPPIISDLAFMLIVAGIVTIIFKWLKQPVVLGYIIAGFITGPHIDFFPTVIDNESITIWGEIGVIFLLFGMGLEFSFKKLIKNSKTGFITLMMIVLGLGVSGYFLGTLMGWSHWDSIILGCMLCLSSTTIIVKGFEEPQYKGKRFTEVVFGILIFDDLFAILVMVFLGTIAVSSQQIEGTEILLSLGKLVFFMVVWVVGGIFIVPSFLKKMKHWLNDETLLIVSLGLCLGMVVFATKVELSSALGAFIMGSILAETIALENIERVTKPIKDFFGAIFFVSVGMLMDPAIVLENYKSIIFITLLVLFGKIVFTTWGARLSGESMFTSIQCGFSMAQVGEFAFIVAGTAIMYGLADNFIYPIIIAVSVITTFTTPYLMAASPTAYHFMMKSIPQSWQEKIIAKDEKLASTKPTSLWGSLLKSYVFSIVIFVSLGLAVILLSSSFLQPLLIEHIGTLWGNIACLLITLIVISPMLKGLVYRGGEQPFLILELWKQSVKYRLILSMLIVLRYVIAFGFIYSIFDLFLDIPIWVSGIAAIALLILLFRSKYLLKLYWNMEYHFVINFNERIINEKRKFSKRENGVTSFDLNNESWIEQNLYVGRFKIDKNSEYENKKLKDTDFRSRYGLIIIEVDKNDEESYFPNGDFILMEGEFITVVGNIMQIKKLSSDKNQISLDKKSLQTIHQFAKKQGEDPNSQIKCVSIIIDKESGLYEKSLLQSEIGKRGKSFIVGIERNNSYEINPLASTVFKEDDIIWIVGGKNSIYEILKENFYF
ncbi:sodium/hydrogen exchanger [Bacteroides coprosuis DSM 18011]|uniref:Sodium/hydrogen exchanger n=3 Tax=Bacteroides TaxID=816 RepID=F3ZTN0_9BACE|nr:cation:proton antiporter [Bacteroides coprosuis]EGJ71261.1 sodium/hydrogen exchanger [Bacteroides coprosuis DSM 18011]